MSELDSLGFVDALRTGEPNWQERRYFDNAINGRPLRAMIDPGDKQRDPREWAEGWAGLGCNTTGGVNASH